jgi:methionine synthase II (cobalamin-independent)
MIEIEKGMEELIKKELERAGKIYGVVNHSNHESYSVILEELEEAGVELIQLHHELREFWDEVKKDKENTIEGSEAMQEHLKHMTLCAKLAACELVQVAAMCQKASDTVDVLQDKEKKT